ncbi:MAG: hypothetical protein V4695_03250 [Pseudomonadota bacterium]
MNALLPIRLDHPAYAGHFPDKPILPGVVLLDEALHAIGHYFKADLSACVVKTAKFLSPVQPGEAVMVSFTAASNNLVRFELHSDTRLVATGVLCLPNVMLVADANDK